jgi:alpha-L-arabinofuranosidase
VIAVNTGFGDAYSAAAASRVRQRHHPKPPWALRAENGHPEPYGVKWWCVGNEMWGNWQLGYMQLDALRAQAQLGREDDAQRTIRPSR